jgi:hypothetical protein
MQNGILTTSRGTVLFHRLRIFFPQVKKIQEELDQLSSEAMCDKHNTKPKRNLEDSTVSYSTTQ